MHEFFFEMYKRHAGRSAIGLCNEWNIRVVRTSGYTYKKATLFNSAAVLGVRDRTTIITIPVDIPFPKSKFWHEFLIYHELAHFWQIHARRSRRVVASDYWETELLCDRLASALLCAWKGVTVVSYRNAQHFFLYGLHEILEKKDFKIMNATTVHLLKKSSKRKEEVVKEIIKNLNHC